MFGIGGSEILVILVVALLFLGPDKLPEAAKTISKGIRDLKKQSRALQQQIENDERIGGAIRDLKSALRGEEPPPTPKPPRARLDQPEPPPVPPPVPTTVAEQTEAALEDGRERALDEAKPVVTLPATAGEADPDVKDETSLEEIGSLIKPASGTVAKHAPTPIAKADPPPIPKVPKPAASSEPKAETPTADAKHKHG